MYVILFFFCFILFYFLIRIALKSTRNGAKFLLVIIAVAALSSAILILFANQYQNLHADGLVILLIMAIALGLLFNIRGFKI